MENIVSSIICSTFETAIGRWQARQEKQQHAMLVSFKQSIDYEVEDGYRFLDIFIYAPTNYVGVLARHRWTVIPLDELDDSDDSCLKPGCDYRIGNTNWKIASYHDSCWNSDGVQSIIRMNKNTINTISFNGSGWYQKIEMTKEWIEIFEKLTSNDRVPENYYHDTTTGVLHFGVK